MILSRIENPGINIHHSTTFSWDGNTLVIGDELGGAAVAPGCVVPNSNSPTGALWFYDVSNRSLPVPRSHYHIPQQDLGTVCSAHNFNTLPLTSNRDVLTSGWYSGATSVVDFTDPANPTQIGYYIPKTTTAANSWSSYLYRDRIYANNRNVRGVDVHALNDAALLSDAMDLTHLNPQTQEPRGPTAVAIRSLRAAATGKGVVVRWRTGSETNLAGFNLYRSRGTSKPIRVNPTLIPARSATGAAGRSYSYTDRGGRREAIYRLELVGLDGRQAWGSGTVTAR